MNERLAGPPGVVGQILELLQQLFELFFYFPHFSKRGVFLKLHGQLSRRAAESVLCDQ